MAFWSTPQRVKPSFLPRSGVMTRGHLSAKLGCGRSATSVNILRRSHANERQENFFFFFFTQKEKRLLFRQILNPFRGCWSYREINHLETDLASFEPKLCRAIEGNKKNRERDATCVLSNLCLSASKEAFQSIVSLENLWGCSVLPHPATFKGRCSPKSSPHWTRPLRLHSNASNSARYQTHRLKSACTTLTHTLTHASQDGYYVRSISSSVGGIWWCKKRNENTDTNGKGKWIWRQCIGSERTQTEANITPKTV